MTLQLHRVGDSTGSGSARSSIPTGRQRYTQSPIRAGPKVPRRSGHSYQNKTMLPWVELRIWRSRSCRAGPSKPGGRVQAAISMTSPLHRAVGVDAPGRLRPAKHMVRVALPRSDHSTWYRRPAVSDQEHAHGESAARGLMHPGVMRSRTRLDPQSRVSTASNYFAIEEPWVDPWAAVGLRQRRVQPAALLVPATARWHPLMDAVRASKWRDPFQMARGEEGEPKRSAAADC